MGGGQKAEGILSKEEYPSVEEIVQALKVEVRCDPKLPDLSLYPYREEALSIIRRLKSYYEDHKRVYREGLRGYNIKS